MYPYFLLFWKIPVYFFWIFLTICFFLFLWMLKRVSTRFWFNSTFFTNRILWYFLSVFLFSRIFFIISRWSEFKYIKSPTNFFIMNDYNLSLMWWIIWFLFILFISWTFYKLKLAKYIDAFILSFLFVSIFWYIWAFLWGQIYWNETSFWIEILYNKSISNVPYYEPIFPLALVYSLVFFILFSWLYMISMFISIRGIIWYVGLILFSSTILYLEQFNWKTDDFFLRFGINFSQICAIFLIFFSLIWLLRLNKIDNKQEII